MVPPYVVVEAHSGNCVIDEACYSKVLPEPYYILGPNNANHICNNMDIFSGHLD